MWWLMGTGMGAPLFTKIGWLALNNLYYWNEPLAKELWEGDLREFWAFCCSIIGVYDCYFY